MSIAAAHSQTRPFYRSSYRNAYRRNAVNTGFHGTSYRDNYSSGRINVRWGLRYRRYANGCTEQAFRACKEAWKRGSYSSVWSGNQSGDI